MTTVLIQALVECSDCQATAPCTVAGDDADLDIDSLAGGHRSPLSIRTLPDGWTSEERHGYVGDKARCAACTAKRYARPKKKRKR